MTDTAQSLALIGEELGALRETPLSVRRTLLCAALIDRLAEGAFAERQNIGGQPSGDDISTFRRRLRAACPDLGTIADLCGMAEGAPGLRLVTVPAPASDVQMLEIADFMVSLYNRHTVQRVVVTGVAGEPEALPLLERAATWWRLALGSAAAVVP